MKEIILKKRFKSFYLEIISLKKILILILKTILMPIPKNIWRFQLVFDEPKRYIDFVESKIYIGFVEPKSYMDFVEPKSHKDFFEPKSYIGHGFKFSAREPLLNFFHLPLIVLKTLVPIWKVPDLNPGFCIDSRYILEPVSSGTSNLVLYTPVVFRFSGTPGNIHHRTIRTIYFCKDVY